MKRALLAPDKHDQVLCKPAIGPDRLLHLILTTRELTLDLMQLHWTCHVMSKQKLTITGVGGGGGRGLKDRESMQRCLKTLGALQIIFQLLLQSFELLQAGVHSLLNILSAARLTANLSNPAYSTSLTSINKTDCVCGICK